MPVSKVLVVSRPPTLGCFVPEKARWLRCPLTVVTFSVSSADERRRWSSYYVKSRASLRDTGTFWRHGCRPSAAGSGTASRFFFFLYISILLFLSSVAKCLIPTLTTMKYDGQINIIQSILASLSMVHFPVSQRIVKIKKNKKQIFSKLCDPNSFDLVAKERGKKRLFCTPVQSLCTALQLFSSFYYQYYLLLF